MGNKIIIFVDAYRNLPITIYIIEKYRLDSEINIYVYQKNIFKLINEFNKLFWNKEIKLNYIKKYYKANNFINNINLFAFKRKLNMDYNNNFNKTEGYHIYFFTRNYNLITMFFIKKLSCKNDIYLIDINTEKQNGRVLKLKETKIKYLIKDIINKIIIDKRIAMFTDNNSIFPHMTDEYLKKYIDKTFNINDFSKEINNTNEKYREKFSYKYEKYEMIFFDQPLEEKYNLQNKDFYDRLSNIFNNYFKNFVIKLHPRQSESNLKNNLINNIVKTNIPGEYLLNKKTKFYISYFSTTIFGGEKYIDKSAKRIMLVYLLPFKNEKRKDKIREMVNVKAKGEILFPKSFRELEQILKEG